MSIRILCLGNELASDDGIGIRVGRVLSELELPSDVVVELRRMIGFELLDSAELGTELIIVDATRTGRAPGTCRVLDLADIVALSTTAFCCHGVGLPQLLEALRRVRPQAVPERVRLVGVEVETVDQASTELSPAVRRALPTAVLQTLELVGASAVLLEQGRRRAEALVDWQPAPTEVIG